MDEQNQSDLKTKSFITIYFLFCSSHNHVHNGIYPLFIRSFVHRMSQMFPLFKFQL